MMYYDMDNDKYVTTEQLSAEYEELKKTESTDASTLAEYIESRMDFNDGPLEMNLRSETYDWLETVGNAVTADNKCVVERVDMCGGKYMKYDEHEEVAGLTDSIDDVFEWLEI